MLCLRKILTIFIALLCILSVCCYAADKEVIESPNTSLLARIHAFLSKTELFFSGIVVLLNAYHVAIVFKVFFSKPKRYPKAEPQSIAVFICAKDEEAVIGDLLSCIKNQDYPKELITTFVVADHCTDNTENIAREAGAVVYKRSENDGIGKGYALRFLSRKVAKDYPEGFDSYLVLDADNLIPTNFFQKMNDALRSGYDVATSFRNTKNFGDNFVSAALSIWFIGESRIFCQPRSELGLPSWVGGTGFIMSRNVMESMGEWNYLSICEDFEFTIDQLMKGRSIGFCEEAKIFDEQTTSFMVAQKQKLRWVKGLLQVLSMNGKRIMKSIFQGNFGVYDLFMINIMCFVSPIIGIVVFPFFYGLLNVLSGAGFLSFFIPCLESLAMSYVFFVLLGSTATFCAWKDIRGKTWMKICNIFYFAMFMISYLPIIIMALFMDVNWTHVPHVVKMNDFNNRLGEEQISLTEKTSNKLASD